MFLSVREMSKRWGIHPTGVLHVGAHHAEESSDYTQFGWTPVIWVEANPALIAHIVDAVKEKFDRVICAAVWDANDVVKSFHVSNFSQSSSLLEFGTHAQSYKEISTIETLSVRTSRLDAILTIDEMPNFCSLDIQGVELNALYGLGHLIDRLDFIKTEVNKLYVY